jgi:hypothetical protein
MIASVCGLAVVFALVTTGIGQGGDAKTYDVKLHRPSKVGDKVQFTASTSERQTVNATVGGQSRKQDEKFNAEASGVLEVLAVDSKGNETKITATIEKCVKVDGDKRTDLAPKGTVVIAERKDGQLSVTSKDPNEALSDEAVRALKTLLPVDKSDSATTDDEIFGTNQKRKVGESWAVNAEAVAKNLAAELPGVKKENISGQVKLQSVKTVNGVECLELAIEMTFKDLAPPMPAGMKVEKGEGKMTMIGTVPIDPSVALKAGDMRMEFTILSKGTAGDPAQEITTEARMESQLKIQTTPLKK